VIKTFFFYLLLFYTYCTCTLYWVHKPVIIPGTHRISEIPEYTCIFNIDILLDLISVILEKENSIFVKDRSLLKHYRTNIHTYIKC